MSEDTVSDSTIKPALALTALVGWSVSAGFALRVSKRPVLEGAIALGVLLTLCLRKPLRCLLARMPAAHRLVFATLIGAMLAGQIAGLNRVTFPFAQWDMYGEPDAHSAPGFTTLYQLAGIDGAGGRRWVNPLTLFPSFRPSVNIMLLERLANEPHVSTKPHDFLAAVGRRHKQLNPGQSFVAIQLVAVRHALGNPDERSESVIREVRLDGGK